MSTKWHTNGLSTLLVLAAASGVFQMFDTKVALGLEKTTKCFYTQPLASGFFSLEFEIACKQIWSRIILIVLSLVTWHFELPNATH